jgi:hypothetical protein
MNGGSGGGGGPGTIIVEDLDSSTTYNDIHTVQLIGGGFTTSTPSTGVVEINIPGGGGGSALEYGKITGSTKGANAVWTYTVQRYSGGSISGSPVTAFNLLEYGNTAGSAYGYAVSGAGNDQITGTAYYVRAVPTNAWVRLEQTGDMPGGTAYWFSAPNRIDGGC